MLSKFEACFCKNFVRLTHVQCSVLCILCYYDILQNEKFHRYEIFMVWLIPQKYYSWNNQYVCAHTSHMLGSMKIQSNGASTNIFDHENFSSYILWYPVPFSAGVWNPSQPTMDWREWHDRKGSFFFWNRWICWSAHCGTVSGSSYQLVCDNKHCHGCELCWNGFGNTLLLECGH